MQNTSWKNPAIIAAIIAAAAAIIVAILQVGFPKKPVPEAQHTEQHTSGPGSPAIANTGGDVTITEGQGKPDK